MECKPLYCNRSQITNPKHVDIRFRFRGFEILLGCELFLAPAYSGTSTKGIFKPLKNAALVHDDVIGHASVCASYSFMVQPNMVFVTSLCFYVLSIGKCLHNFRIFFETRCSGRW